jgi:hypothetical protein
MPMKNWLDMENIISIWFAIELALTKNNSYKIQCQPYFGGNQQLHLENSMD